MPEPQPLTQAIEEYLEAIQRVSSAGAAPTTTRLAAELGVKPASVTGMLKRLAEMGLITYRRYRRIALTPEGERCSRAMVRRHRLAERLLTDVLGVPLDQVHGEACRLEHALSPEVETRIARTLGDPKACPHGHPIDLRSGGRGMSLLEAPRNRPLTLLRLEDESPDVVRYLSERKLLPQVTLIVRDCEPPGDRVVLEVDGETHTIDRGLAATICVLRPRRQAKA